MAGGLALDVGAESGGDLTGDGAIPALRKPANLGGELERDVGRQRLESPGGRFTRSGHALPIG
jgi:hypothetical protein